MFLPESWLKLANRKSGQDFAKYGEMFIVTAHHQVWRDGGIKERKKPLNSRNPIQLLLCILRRKDSFSLQFLSDLPDLYRYRLESKGSHSVHCLEFRYDHLMLLIMPSSYYSPGLPILNYAVNFLPTRVYINKGFVSAKNLLC